MITATDALRLPSARLSASDADAVTSLLAEIDNHVRANMQRRGVAIPIPLGRLNPAIMAEVGRACRKAGWLVAWQEAFGESALIVGQGSDKRHMLVGFTLGLEPSAQAYDDADAEAQS